MDISGVAALKILFRRKLIQASITVDGVTESGAVTTIMVANFGALLSDRITLGPEIQSDYMKEFVSAYKKRVGEWNDEAGGQRVERVRGWGEDLVLAALGERCHG